MSIDIGCSLAQPTCHVFLSSNITSHCLAVAPQSGAKQNFYCTINYKTLNSNCVAQRAFKKLQKIELEEKNNAQVI
jgi:hypothetical protein